MTYIYIGIPSKYTKGGIFRQNPKKLTPISGSQHAPQMIEESKRKTLTHGFQQGEEEKKNPKMMEKENSR
jgi:hypothetical protein